MKRDCMMPSAWGAASKGFFCATVFGLSMQIGPVLAQSGQSLPPVTVDAPKPQAARPTQPSRRAARSQSGARRVTAPAQQQQQQNSRSAGRGGIGERGTGPVVGYLASQSVTATKTDTPILDDAAVDLGGDKGSDRGPGRPEPHRGAALYAGRRPYELWRQRVLRFLQAQGLRRAALSRRPAAAGSTTRRSPSRASKPTAWSALEVLKGPSAGLYGQSEPGGLINMVSKRPTCDAAIRDRGHASARSSAFRARSTSAVRSTRTASFSIASSASRATATRRPTSCRTTSCSSRRASPGVRRWTPASRSSRTTRRSRTRAISNTCRARSRFLPNPNGRIPYSRYLGEPGPDGYNLEQFAVGYAFEHRFNNNLQFRQNLRYTDVTNDLASVRSEGMADRIPLSLRARYNYVKADAAEHRARQSAAGGFPDRAAHPQGSRRRRLLQSPAPTPTIAVAGIAPIDAFAPVYGAAVPSFASLPPFIHRRRQAEAGRRLSAGSDQARPLDADGERPAGLGAARIRPARRSFRCRALICSDDSANTGRVGLNYLFDFGLSPYVSYSTSFTPTSGADRSPATRSSQRRARAPKSASSSSRSARTSCSRRRCSISASRTC